MLIVQVCDFGNDGDAQYRLHDPSRALSRHEDVTVVDCHFAHRFLPDLAQAADVLVVQFVDDWELLSVCARRRAAGKVTIFEANDYFFDLQPWSPIAAKWRDRTVQELYLQWLAQADGVQTSTDELARRWRQRGARQTAVFENQLVDVPALSPVPDRPFTIGWGGSPGHFADWYQTAPYLARWLDEHPDVHLAVMTHDIAQTFFRLPAERYHFTGFGSLADYLRFLGSLDAGVVPLLPTGYNRCRSDVKFLEYASRGVVGIYADLEPYRGSIVPGETGFLFRTPAELIERLELLRTNPALRQRLRAQAHQYVREHRRLSDHVGKRLAWYRGLLLENPPRSDVHAEIADAAVADERYLQLKPAAPERLLMSAQEKQSPGEAVSLLAPLAGQEPRYLSALQKLGQLLNTQRDHRQAFEVLERARALQPHSARTLCEIGRTWYWLDNRGRAMAVLKEAVGMEPLYLPGWQYLLRLLALERDADGPEWARRADELFPSCYPLALLGAQCYPGPQIASVLLRLVDRIAASLTPEEQPVALAAFRQAILSAIQLAPTGENVATLLRRACEVFPESARLASELGAALERAGEAEEAWQHHARALRLARQTRLYQEEFPREQAPAWTWQFAEYSARAHDED
jgi:tetratricopeptide (TPR) repeat protein